MTQGALPWAATGALDEAAPARFVAPAPGLLIDPGVSLRLRAADLPLVAEGELVEVGQAIIEQAHETVLLEVPARDGLEAVAPGTFVDAARLPGTGAMGRHHARPGDRARLLSISGDGLARIALGRSPQIVLSPVGGRIEEVSAGRMLIRASGVGLSGPVGWGQPALGRLVLAVPSPDAELRASSIDIGAAGGVLVAGARLDIEALTRARAIGVAGIICGGVVGRELHQLEESDQRQRAALHAGTPFAVLTLDGYGRRPIPTLAWDLLSAAATAGRIVGLVPTARLAVVAGDPAGLPLPLREPDAVRITSGDRAGRVGRLVGLAGPVRRTGGMYQPSGYVEEPASGDGRTSRFAVPLADLERLG